MCLTSARENLTFSRNETEAETMLPVPPEHVRIGPLRCIPDVLAEFGHQPGPVLERARIAPGTLAEPDTAIHYMDVATLLEHAATTADCDHFGMTVGRRCTLEDIGLVGLLAAQAPSVGAALADFVRHIAVFDRVTELRLTVEGVQALFTLDMPAILQGEGRRHALEMCLAITVRVVRELAGEDWTPDRALFPGRSPRSRRPYQDFFRAPLDFNAPHCGLTFPVRWLDHPVQGSQVLRRYLEDYLRGLSVEEPPTLRGRVERAIRAMPSLRQANEESIARTLGMDPSTLRRRLAREAAGFRDILEAATLDRAQHLMRNRDLKLTQVATALGYAELSAFTRAFRRWTGLAPTEWRRRQADR